MGGVALEEKKTEKVNFFYSFFSIPSLASLIPLSRMLPSPRCVSIRPLSCLLLTRGTLGALGTSIRVLLRSQNRESKRQFASQHHRHRCRSIDPNNSSNSTSIPNATTMSVKRDPCPLVLSTWRSARAVCFDVDSTLCTDESIDEIAAFLGVGEQVAALTSQLR